jgi:hypothetical protein
MDRRTRQDERIYWSPTGLQGQIDADNQIQDSWDRDAADSPASMVGDVDPAGLEPPHRGRLGDEQLAQRVGRRRRIRPEVAIAVASVAFISLALLKPWPSTPAVLHPSPIAAASLIATSSPASTVAPGTDLPNVPLTVPADLTQRWSTVDWSGLRASDPHSGWGLTEALMPNSGAGPAIIEGPAGPGTILPMTHWVAAGAPPSSVNLSVDVSDSVYAIAVTWPANVHVSSVTFQYTGGSSYEPYLPPPGFPPFTQVTPLPADRVASPPAAAPAPNARSSAPARLGGGGIKSGQFWVPPAEVSGNAIPAEVISAAWKSLPWPWPDGTYRVTLQTQTGPVTIVLRLQQSA